VALTFYYGSGSPFAWRVWLALEQKSIAYELKVLSFSAGDTRKPEYAALNPRHKVPVISGDGFTLYESAAIVEYLDEVKPQPSLFPGDARQRALVRRMVCEADHYVNAAMSKLAGNVLFVQPDEWDQTAIGAGRDGLLKELATWDHSLGGDFVAGPLSAADFALYPMLAIAMRCEVKKPDLGLKAALPAKVAAWMGRIEALPYFKNTWPPHWK
jgi:glutathione S-transferase